MVAVYMYTSTPHHGDLAPRVDDEDGIGIPNTDVASDDFTPHVVLNIAGILMIQYVYFRSCSFVGN